MTKRIIGLITVLIIGVGLYTFSAPFLQNLKALPERNTFDLTDDAGEMKDKIHPLSIQALRSGEFPGSDITIEQTLAPGSNYSRYIASYKSEGLKIYALLTIPTGQMPASGWPTIIFNHGYIPPNEYVTTERYIAYTDAFSRNGYIVLRSENSYGTELSAVP